MRMLVLGAGLQGSACAYDLLQSPAVTEVRLADRAGAMLPGFLNRYRGGPRLQVVDLDAEARAKGQTVMPRDVAVAAMAPHLNKPDAKDLVALRVIVEGTNSRLRARWSPPPCVLPTNASRASASSRNWPGGALRFTKL